jgi:hypothetical protein
MWHYWLLFVVSVWMALRRLRTINSSENSNTNWSVEWIICFLTIGVGIGLRHEVGADWFIYQNVFESEIGASLKEYLATPLDPAYAFLSWVSGNIFGSIYFVNLICGLIFSWGLVEFCRSQPRPWLALLVAVPYLVTVVAMGYTRQGVAIGVAMLAMSSLIRGNLWRFLLWMSLAMTFHKSAIVLIPFAFFSISHNSLLSVAIVFCSIAVLFLLMVQEALPFLITGYIESEYESAGASLRVGMNALPAMLFLLFRKRFLLSELEKKFWTMISFSGLLFIFLLFLVPQSSTAIDRLALYWIPLQIFVWSRLPSALGESPTSKRRWVLLVVVYCFIVYFVWLNFSIHSEYWIPYQFYPWKWLWS